MQITFTKNSDLEYVSHIVRADGTEYEIKSYDKPKWLPHDLAHYLIEKTLKLKHGFWGCLEAGAIVPSMRLLKGKQKPKAMEHSQKVLREAGQHANEAEIWVGFFLHAAAEKLDQQSPNLLQSKLNNMWLSSKPERQTVSFAEARQLCQQLRDFSEQWQALEEGASLSFQWGANLTKSAR